MPDSYNAAGKLTKDLYSAPKRLEVTKSPYDRWDKHLVHVKEQEVEWGRLVKARRWLYIRMINNSLCTLDMKDVIVSGLYLALTSKFGGVELR